MYQIVYNVRISFFLDHLKIKMIVFFFSYFIEHIAQMVNQQSPGGANNNTQSSNNNNTNVPDPILSSTFVVQPDSSSLTRNNDTLRSRSADSRPANTNTLTSNMSDDDSDWIDLPAMDMTMPPPQQIPPPHGFPMPRLRGPAIIRKFFPK